MAEFGSPCPNDSGAAPKCQGVQPKSLRREPEKYARMATGRPKKAGQGALKPLSDAHAAFGASLAWKRGDRLQRAVAAAAGINNGTLSDLEAGYTDPKLSTILAIFRVLDVDIGKLFIAGEPNQLAPVNSRLEEALDRLSQLETIVRSPDPSPAIREAVAKALADELAALQLAANARQRADRLEAERAQRQAASEHSPDEIAREKATRSRRASRPA